MRKAWNITHWILLALALAYIADVIYAYPHDHQTHLDQAAVAKINAQRLTPADVQGSQLPPPPDPAVVDATVAGIDANKNGIRDDVELAIFVEYPTSSATSTAMRSAELQYAMELQTELTQVTDTSTWIAAIVQDNRGFSCIYDVSGGKYQPYEDEVETLMFNTAMRKDREQYIWKYAASYKLSMDPDCDVRLS